LDGNGGSSVLQRAAGPKTGAGSEFAMAADAAYAGQVHLNSHTIEAGYD
jgi:hypothetical protein